LKKTPSSATQPALIFR